KEILARGTLKIKSELKDEPEVRASLLNTIGGVYRGLGLPKESRPLLEEALGLRRKQLGADHLDVGETPFELGWLRQVEGDSDESEKCFREAIAIGQKHPGGGSVAGRAQFNLAWLLTQDFREDEAERLFREVIDRRVKQLGDEHHDVVVARAGL